MTDKQYFAFYSVKAQCKFSEIHKSKLSGVYKYRLVDGSGDIETTAVYQCSKYSSPEEVLQNQYLFDDAKFVGIVDKWLQSYMK